MRFEIHRSKSLFRRGQFYWKLIANNNRSIATSGETYHNLGDCEDAIDKVKATGPATIVRMFA